MSVLLLLERDRVGVAKASARCCYQSVNVLVS